MSQHEIRSLHDWDVSPKEAVELQERLRHQVRLEGDPQPVRRVAGVDVSFKEGQARAAVALLSFPELELVEQARAELPTPFPYVPGLLTFREGPVVLDAFERLTLWPDLVIFDGQGLAHPRHFGLACHVGLFLDLPSIGCAKSRLFGTHEEPGPDKGAWVPLYDDEQVIGAVVRTRTRVKPLFVSPGHRITLERSIDYVLACCPRYRLPETTRWAHRLAGRG